MTLRTPEEAGIARIKPAPRKQSNHNRQPADPNRYKADPARFAQLKKNGRMLWLISPC